jgi:cytochrome c peroxidase
MQQAMAQFIRSIQSFDSRYDQGRTQVNNDAMDFPNFTANENSGKRLFILPPPAGGAGCVGCHRPPEFDIDPATGNNGIIGQAGSQGGADYTNTRAPSLRDIVNPSGDLNGPLMHTGEITSLEELIDHYNAVPQDPNNTNLDNRLAGPGGNLNLSNQEKADLVAFLATLTGSDIYTNEIWSDPFDENGNLTVETSTGIAESFAEEVQLFPNPASDFVQIAGLTEVADFNLFSVNGQLVKTGILYPNERIAVNDLQRGVYLISLSQNGEEPLTIRFVKSR